MSGDNEERDVGKHQGAGRCCRDHDAPKWQTTITGDPVFISPGRGGTRYDVDCTYHQTVGKLSEPKQRGKDHSPLTHGEVVLLPPKSQGQQNTNRSGEHRLQWSAESEPKPDFGCKPDVASVVRGGIADRCVMAGHPRAKPVAELMTERADHRHDDEGKEEEEEELSMKNWLQFNTH